ncbi:rep protein [Bat adeno-associated virus YNM]|uniref:Rep protein n=1 Tax=Bat adeno-associated virus TaxID=740950 RepID=E0XJJ4_9VIRU|nr:rep protein [Bat adeno-associated virus YNM]ADD17085.1 rep protein [Bat adeno-associated virus YNM]
MEFYSIVLRLPGDFDSEVPGLQDSFYKWISGPRRELPEWSDLDPGQIESAYQILADKLVREFAQKWAAFSEDPRAPYFAQLEKGRENFHVHVLASSKKVGSFVVGRYVRKMRQHLVDVVFRKCEPVDADWLQVQKSGNHKSNEIKDEGFIPAYLLPKRQSELQWAWTNIEKYERATLSVAERARLVEEWKRSLAAEESDPAEPERRPRKSTKSASEYMALVRWLVDNGIATEREWMREDSDGYLSYNATGATRAQIKAALDNAARIMVNTKTAADYLVGRNPPLDVEDNRIYRLFRMNGYDPAYAGSVLLGWCRTGFGKRNTVWLFGPATTGKTNLAEAISHSVPFYGCVNWTNENFPFNDCVDKMIIWWEEGKMTSKVVESAKAILGGSKVRVDQKCKNSQQIEPTPVIITSNTNMCEVVDGNSTTFEHRQPLEDRMFKFELTVRLQPTFGKITKQEVREFFKWAELNAVDVEYDFLVRKINQSDTGGGVKRGAEPTKDEPPAKRVFFYGATSEGEDVREGAPGESDSVNFAERYVSKCSKHLSWSNMRYPCRACERMNADVNVCTPHGCRDCPECFPRPAPVPIAEHDLCLAPIEDSDFYVGCIDDVNKEQ